MIIREPLAEEYVEKNAQRMVLDQREVAEFEKGIEIEYRGYSESRCDSFENGFLCQRRIFGEYTGTRERVCVGLLAEANRSAGQRVH